MASTDRKIRITIVLDNSLYFAFHEKAQDAGATHNGIVRKLIRSWVSQEAADPTQPVKIARK